MAIAKPQSVFFLAGRVCVGPTDLSLEFPFGGTAIGSTSDAALVVRHRDFLVTGEEFGGVAVDRVQVGDEVALSMTCRGFDLDAIRLALDGALDASGFAGLTGEAGSDRRRATSVAVLVAPRSTDHHPALYLPAALVSIAPEARIDLSSGKEFGVPINCVATPDANLRRTYELRRLAGITL